jgi:hypothetical protein
MGGIGSGREAEVYSDTVEESLSLDVNWLVRIGIIRQGFRSDGTIGWETFGAASSTIGYETSCYIDTGYIRLLYTTSRIAFSRNYLSRKQKSCLFCDLFKLPSNFRKPLGC